jgi:hypothetical protein
MPLECHWRLIFREYRSTSVDPVNLDAVEQIRDQLKFEASFIASQINGSQLGKFSARQGHGFAAEEANHIADVFRGARPKLVGKNNACNGADRFVRGEFIQSKYCRTPPHTVNAAFDSASGNYRYGNQVLEVPRDQYEASVKLMRNKITRGKVPGVIDPEQATKLVKRGSVTYNQARNIARAGNLDSLIFDAKTQAISSVAAIGASAVVTFVSCKLRGESTRDAFKSAISIGLVSGVTSFSVGVLAAQALRAAGNDAGHGFFRVGVTGLSRIRFGRQFLRQLAAATGATNPTRVAAVNSHLARLARTNFITGGITVLVTTSPDFYRAVFHRSISWKQLAKNAAVNSAGLAGGTGGMGVGALVGSVVPGIGTVIGGGVGALAGALIGGGLTTAGAKYLADMFCVDDAVELTEILQQTAAELAHDHLLTETEAAQVAKAIRAHATPEWFRAMFATGSDALSRRKFAEQELSRHFDEQISMRQKIVMPPLEEILAAYQSLLEEESATVDDGESAREPSPNSSHA